MPRTETCTTCNASGQVPDYGPLGRDFEGPKECPDCDGNGYITTPVTFENMTAEECGIRDPEEVQQRIEELRTEVEQEPMPEIPDVFGDIDLTDDTPTPGRMANQTWRILEEQRQAAEETVRECDIEIARWEKKKADAARTIVGCEAGQVALEGRS